MHRLQLHCPINSLSLGQVSFNILRELYRLKIQVILFPKGNIDLSAYKYDSQFAIWLERSISDRFTKTDRKIPTLAIWHIQDSQFKPSDRQYTLTWHETDSPTNAEINIVNQQEHTFFTSSWSVDNFRTYGAQNVSFVPLGLDEDFVPAQERVMSDNVTHWICVGKWEDLRKMTTQKIQTWIKLYGGNRAHQLSLCVTNPFLRPEDMNALYNRAFNGNKPFNVNVLPPLKTNAEMLALYQSADVDISGIARSEGWNIPSHTVTCLGKWSAVTNVTAHRDWANSENAVLIEQSGMVKAVDGIFFHGAGPFNIGNMYDFKQEDIEAAMKELEKRAKTVNQAGLVMREKATYAKTIDMILEKIGD